MLIMFVVLEWKIKDSIGGSTVLFSKGTVVFPSWTDSVLVVPVRHAAHLFTPFIAISLLSLYPLYIP